MRYSYFYSVYLRGFDRDLKRSWSYYCGTFSTLPDVRGCVFAYQSRYPDCDAYVVRTLRSRLDVSRFYVVDPKTLRLSSCSAHAALNCISAGNDVCPLKR